MKSLKMKILIFASLIFMLILNLNPISYATDASSNPKYIGITELKTESEIGYAIGNFTLGGIVLATLAGGVFLIKKFVI